MSWTEVINGLINDLLSWPVALVITVVVLRAPLGGVLNALAERIRIGGLKVSHSGKETSTEVIVSASQSFYGEIQEVEEEDPKRKS